MTRTLTRNPALARDVAGGVLLMMGGLAACADPVAPPPSRARAPQLVLSAPAPITSRYCNATRLDIPAGAPNNSYGPASLYPSPIVVAGAGTALTKVTVTLVGLRHTFPDDIDVLLVGPRGQKMVLMSDVGGARQITDVTLTF